MAEQLIDAALEAGGGDNVTVALARVTEVAEEDDWQPEATAPPVRFDPRMDQTVADDGEDAPGMQLPPPPCRSRLPLAAALSLALALLVVLVVAVAGRARPVKVYVRQEGTPPAGALTVTAGGLGALALQTDAQGAFVTLPGHDPCELTLSLAGHEPQQIKVSPAPDAKSVEVTAQAWVALAALHLQLPPYPPPAQLRVMREQAGGGEPVQVQALAGNELVPGAERVLELKPYARHTIIIRAEGYGDFVTRVELPPGASRTIKVFFTPEATPAP
jgi:hypothetical protein